MPKFGGYQAPVVTYEPGPTRILKELAQELGYTHHSALSHYMRRHGCDLPVKRVAGVKYWDREAFLAWHAEAKKWEAQCSLPRTAKEDLP